MAIRYKWFKYRTTTGTGVATTQIASYSGGNGNSSYQLGNTSATIKSDVSNKEVTMSSKSGGGSYSTSMRVDALRFPFIQHDLKALYEYTGTEQLYWCAKYADPDYEDEPTYIVYLGTSSRGASGVLFNKHTIGQTTAKGALVGTVYSTTSSTAYPSDGVYTDGYWYVYQGSEEYANVYVGVGSKAKGIKKIYVGVSGEARRVKKIYVGVGGKARRIM